MSGASTFFRLLAAALLMPAGAFTGCLLDPAITELDDFFLGYAMTAGTVTTIADATDPAPTTTDTPDSLTDNGDGTVTSTRNGKTLMYAKCNQGTGAGNTQYGGGGATDPCTSGAGFTGTYCSANDNSCNGGMDSGTLDGGGTSQVYASCAGLTAGGHTDWRVATITELIDWRFDLAQAEPNLFPNFAGGAFWSATSLDLTQALRMDAGGNLLITPKAAAGGPVRCVRDV